MQQQYSPDQAVIQSDTIADSRSIDSAINTKILYDQVNVRLPVDLNDWLNNAVRTTKRLHGSKIPKEIIIEAAIKALKIKAQDTDWSNIKTKEDLLDLLLNNN